MRPVAADEPLFAELLSRHPGLMSDESTTEDVTDTSDREDQPDD